MRFAGFKINTSAFQNLTKNCMFANITYEKVSLHAFTYYEGVNSLAAINLVSNRKQIYEKS